MAEYREKHSKSKWTVPAEVVIRERVMTKRGYGFSERRPLEEQVEQLVQVMAELCEEMNIDATKFNDDYEKVSVIKED